MMIYRNLQNGRFRSVRCQYRHSNLSASCPGDTSEKETGKPEQELSTRVKELYRILESFIKENPEFKKTHSPWNGFSDIPLIRNMIGSSSEAGVGPMAAVAGAFADELLDDIFSCMAEGIIENGGDISMKNVTECNIAIYPGWNGLDTEIILKIPPGRWGIATSSGKFGHSFSKGTADMVTVVSKTGAHADSFATSIGNSVMDGCDPEKILEEYSHLYSVTIIWRAKLWHRGKTEIEFRQ